MKKPIILLIASLIICISSLSGCTDFDWGDPLGIERSTEVCGVIILIVVILIIILLIGLAKAGTKKNIVIQTPLQPAPQPPVVIKQESKDDTKPERRCPECGRVIPMDSKMCPYCGKKFKSHFEEEKKEKESINEKEEETKKQLKEKTKPPKHCPECGYKFEEEDLDFCPKCGIKLK